MPHRYKSALTLIFLTTLVSVFLAYATGVAGLTMRQFLTGTATGNPKAVLKYTEWDFGSMEAGPVLQARFPIRDSGTRRLVLREKSRSCDCVMPGQPEVIVAPGDQRELVVKLDTRRQRGAVALQVSYYCNDPELPTITLTVLAEISAAEGEEQTGSQGLQPIPDP